MPRACETASGTPDHISDAPRGPEQRNTPAKLVEGGANTNIVSFNIFPADRTVSFKLGVGEEGTDNRRKKREAWGSEEFYSRIA